MTFRVPERLGYVVEDEGDGPVLFLCPLPHGPATAVSGSGAVIWLSALTDGTSVAEAVAADYEVEVDGIREEVERYLAYLLDAGFLEEAP